MLWHSGSYGRKRWWGGEVWLFESLPSLPAFPTPSRICLLSPHCLTSSAGLPSACLGGGGRVWKPGWGLLGEQNPGTLKIHPAKLISWLQEVKGSPGPWVPARGGRRKQKGKGEGYSNWWTAEGAQGPRPGAEGHHGPIKQRGEAGGPSLVEQGGRGSS